MARCGGRKRALQQHQQQQHALQQQQQSEQQQSCKFREFLLLFGVLPLIWLCKEPRVRVSKVLEGGVELELGPILEKNRVGSEAGIGRYVNWL